MPETRKISDSPSPAQPLPRQNSFGSLFVTAALDWYHDNALRLSAAVSYYAVLSLAPLLALIIRVISIAHARQFAREQIIAQVANLMGTQAADAIKPIIQSNDTYSGSYLTTIISTIILLFSATGVFMELQNSMNTIWGVQNKPHPIYPARHAILNYLRSRLLSLAMVFALGLLLVCSIFFSGIATALRQRIAHVDQWPAYFADIATSCAIEFAVLIVLFKLLPNLPLKWRNVWPGALLAALLFTAGRFGLAIYFKYSRINSVYGAAGSLIAVLTWIYYSSFSIFFGVEFTKVWTKRYDATMSVPND